MKYYLNTQFAEHHEGIELLSIGLVAEDGREYYAENAHANLDLASDWVKELVVPALWGKSMDTSDVRDWDGCVDNDPGAALSGGVMPLYAITFTLKQFLDPQKYGDPRLTSYYAPYHWVNFCQLFGGFAHLPNHYVRRCNDAFDDILWYEQKFGCGRGKTPQYKERTAISHARWLRDYMTIIETARQAVRSQWRH